MADHSTDVMAFPERQVMRLTGLTQRQLRYWDNTNFFSPHHEREEAPRGKSPPLYSFRDLVALRTIAMLRKNRVPLQGLRKIGEWLHRWHDTPWASLRFHLAGREVIVMEPGSDVAYSTDPLGQVAIPIHMTAIAEETTEAV